MIGLLGRALDAGGLPLDEYDRRVVAVGAANYPSQLAAQLDGLPPGFQWSPHPDPPPVTPRPPKSYGRTALVLGIVSLPLSMCLVSWIFGILASVYSRRPARGFGPAMIGRVFGIVAILLSIHRRRPCSLVCPAPHFWPVASRSSLLPGPSASSTLANEPGA